MRSLSRSVNPIIGRVRVTRVCGCRPRYVTLQIVNLTSGFYIPVQVVGASSAVVQRMDAA